MLGAEGPYLDLVRAMCTVGDTPRATPLSSHMAVRAGALLDLNKTAGLAVVSQLDVWTRRDSQLH